MPHARQRAAIVVEELAHVSVVGLCMDMCMDMRMDMCMDMCTDVCMDLGTDMCRCRPLYRNVRDHGYEHFL